MSLEQTTRTLVTFTQAKNNPRRIINIGLTQQRMRTVICLQISTVFWTCGTITSVSHWTCVGLVRSGGLKHRDEPLDLAYCLWGEIKERLQIYKSLGTDQITAEPIQLGESMGCSEMHKFMNSIWNKKKLSQQWKESAICFCVRTVKKLTAVATDTYHWSYTLYSSNTWGKMEIQEASISAIYRHQQKLWID
jgi:hypothetical protein